MNIKKLYSPKNDIYPIFECYGSSMENLCNLNNKNSFFENQIEVLFNNTDGINEFLYATLCHRHDYQKVSNIHIINNKITNEIHKCVVNEHSILLESQSIVNTFQEILYQKNRNYVIISLT